MLEIRNYVRAQNLEEAWRLNQKKSNCVLGGMMWLRMESIRIDTAIDLSALHLDQIVETSGGFLIGCMATLRALEQNEPLNRWTCGAVRDAVQDIVGVQFRNLATVGGSIWGRFGFSDLLTVFLALDSSVELFCGGLVPLGDFIRRKKDRDILVHLFVPKKPGWGFAYEVFRNTASDLPVLNVAAAVPIDGEGDFRSVRVAVGARPEEAMLVPMPKDGSTPKNAAEFAAHAAAVVPTASNMRGSAAFRTQLVEVLTRRALDRAARKTGFETPQSAGNAAGEEEQT